MKLRLASVPRPPPLDSRVPPFPVCLHWLGQAGFLIESGALRILVDPYLSDALAQKYAGREFPHARMMPPPAPPSAFRGIDFFCSTHAHSDHLDPGSIPGVAASNPSCRFIVPASARAAALERGVPEDRLIAVDAGDEVALSGTASLSAIPSAHERLEQDEAGREKFLGYIFTLEGRTVYHSGDCVPFPALPEILAARRVDLALLPVNGRDEFRSSRGVPGNFTIEEAFSLAASAGIPFALGHHYGMFDFNTVRETEIRDYLRGLAQGVRGDYAPALMGVEYSLVP